MLDQQRDSLQRSVGEQHALDRNGEPLGEPLAQRQVALRRTVREGTRGVALECPRRRRRDRGGGEEIGGRHAACERNGLHPPRFRARSMRRGSTRSGTRPVTSPPKLTTSFIRRELV